MYELPASHRLAVASFLMLATASGLVRANPGPDAPSVAAAADAPRPQVEQSLSLRQIIEQLRAGNRTIASKQAESRIAATAIERAKGVFQPQADVSAVRGISRVKNSFEEDLIRKALGVYERNGNDYAAGVSQLLSSAPSSRPRPRCPTSSPTPTCPIRTGPPASTTTAASTGLP
jgi:uncharacterized membrane protein